VLHLELLHGLALRQDLREELAQARDVPLPVAEIVEEAALRLRAPDLKRRVERTVGGRTVRSSLRIRSGCRMVSTMLSARTLASSSFDRAGVPSAIVQPRR
jgi:hypothetical protein